MSRPLDPSIRMFMGDLPRSDVQRDIQRVKRRHDGTFVQHVAASANPTERITIVCLSDTHAVPGWAENVPPGDVLVHAGDLSLYGSPAELDACFEQLKALPHQIKLVVAGNHDLGLDRTFIQEHTDPAMELHQITLKQQERLLQRWQGQEAFDAGIRFLLHEAFTITVRKRKLTVFGSPLSPFFCDWAFAYPLEADPWAKLVPKHADIVITHCPPQGIMDQVPGAAGSGHVGCPQLMRRLEQVRPALHVFGHIHEGAEQGLERRKWTTARDEECETLFVNASVLDDQYRLCYSPTVVQL